MTTPTPDEQALTEQIARAVADAQNVPFVGPKQRKIARAVLPVVKTAQREALTAFARDEHARASAITDPGRANRRLQSGAAAELFRDRHYPEEATP